MAQKVDDVAVWDLLLRDTQVVVADCTRFPRHPGIRIDEKRMLTHHSLRRLVRPLQDDRASL